MHLGQKHAKESGRLLVLLAVLTQCARAFVDLRLTSCMTETLMKINPSRSEWHGEINMTMSCDKGFDLPLNAPPKATFVCKPDGSSWSPNFVPDCNKEIRAKVKVAYFLPLTKAACDGNQNKDFAKQWKFKAKGPCSDCILSYSKPVCSIPSRPSANATFDEKLLVGGKPPFMFASVLYPNTDGVTWNSVKAWGDQSLKRVKTFVSGLSESGGAYIKLAVDCFINTVPVVREDLDGAIVCRGCSMGYFLDVAKQKCEQCRPGYFQDLPMSAECMLCPALKRVKDKATWREINSKGTYGAYGMIYCPRVARKDSGAWKILPSRFHMGNSSSFSSPSAHDNKAIPRKQATSKSGAAGLHAKENFIIISVTTCLSVPWICFSNRFTIRK